jgi:hypothetical protein
MPFANRTKSDRSLAALGRAARFDKTALACVALVASAGVAACQGCRTAGGARPSAEAASASVAGDDVTPTARLYLVSDLAGALEPCGCTKDQLGGLDHAAAWMRGESKHAPNAALVSAGPLFFMDPTLKPDHVDQDVAKAETIARVMKTLGFTAFAPGANDWAAGDAELAKLVPESGASLLFANYQPDGGAPPPVPLGRTMIREVGGVKIGVIGVSTAPNQGFTPPVDAIKSGVDALKAQGANVVVALAAIGRGDAKRLADYVPALTAIVVGSAGGSGDVNTPAAPPERLGDVLVLQTGNHLTTVGVLDLFVRGGSYAFADGTGLELAQRREEIRRRVDELRGKIAQWSNDPAVKKEDLDARRAEVTKLESDLASLSAHPTPPSGSFFRYSVQEIRDSLGADAETKGVIAEYYKAVNEHNRVAFANRMPPPHTVQEPIYIGVNACTTCHKSEREFWDGTRHATAYKTLVDQDKQFNLDCVSCHVTGYEQPGGSSVTHVARLEGVQCETCHGAGSKHALDPKHVKPLIAKPKGELCLSCHHPPHVEGFDPEEKMADVIGVGHGL